MNKIHFIAISLIFTFAANIFLVVPTFALEGVTLQIAPTSHKIALEPGNEYTDSISVQNLGDNDFEYKMSVKPYQVQDVFYNPDFVTENNYTQIVRWITFAEPSGNLPAHTSKEIKYTIKVPADVPDGGQYAVLVAEAPGQINPGSIEIIGSVGSILYTHIGGDTREEGNLVSSRIWPLQFGSPVTAESTITNTGNVDFDVTTTINITKILGGNVVYDNSETPLFHTVLPNSTRLILATWYETPKIGLFKVTQVSSFLDQNSTISGVVLVCPFWLAMAVATIIVLLIILIVYYLVSHFKNRSKQRQSIS